MAFSPRDRIDWHFLGSRLRAIDFHFLWMVTAKESKDLWNCWMGTDGQDVTYVSNATRLEFARAANYIDQVQAVRKCEKAFIQSQKRKVGNVFASLVTEGFVTRQCSPSRCITTLRLPIQGGAK